MTAEFFKRASRILIVKVTDFDRLWMKIFSGHSINNKKQWASNSLRMWAEFLSQMQLTSTNHWQWYYQHQVSAHSWQIRCSQREQLKQMTTEFFKNASRILRRPQNFAKSLPYFCLYELYSKVRWKFRKILWPSQNSARILEEFSGHLF